MVAALEWSLQENQDGSGEELSGTYQRLVKTTPNPSATKNRRGELVAFEPELLSPLPVVVAALLAAVVVEGAISGRDRSARFQRNH